MKTNVKVAKELVKLAKILVGGGWGPLRTDTADVLQGILITHKNLSNDQLLALVKKDKNFMKMVKEDNADLEDVKELIEEGHL